MKTTNILLLVIIFLMVFNWCYIAIQDRKAYDNDQRRMYDHNFTSNPYNEKSLHEAVQRMTVYENRHETYKRTD